MYHEIEPSPLTLDGWRCGSVYMHVAHERERIRMYGGAECQAVLDAVNAANAQHAVAADVLLRGAHAQGHPLPGVFTVSSAGYRIDLRNSEHDGKRHLWAEVYKTV